MILVTIGSVFPFDRLVRAMDEVAATLPKESFFAQIGDGAHIPRNMPYARILSRRDFTQRVQASKMIVAHAGMGSIITAMEMGRPIIILPRRWEAGEHNTDHQMATARWLSGKPGVHVCVDERDLNDTVRRVLADPRAGQAMSRAAPEEFVARIREFIGKA